MTEKIQSLGEVRLSEEFIITLLFSEPLQFTLDDVLAAAVEDHPDIAEFAAYRQSLSPSRLGEMHDTGAFIEPIVVGPPGDLIVIGAPGTPYDGDLSVAVKRATLLWFPNAEEVVAAHRSALTLYAKASSTELGARLVQARNLSALASVFAGLPTCTAVNFRNGNVLLPSNMWEFNLRSLDDGFFLTVAWLSLDFVSLEDDSGTSAVGCVSEGLGAFIGQEIVVQPAALDRAEVGKLVVMTAHVLVTSGNPVDDGDTMGLEGYGPEGALLLRFKDEPDGERLPSWNVFHPATVVDHEEIAGPRPQRQQLPSGEPLGVYTKKGFLKRLLQSARGG